MCYPCDGCGRCGKFDEESPLYTPPPTLRCLLCGEPLGEDTERCSACGAAAFASPGTRLED